MFAPSAVHPSPDLALAQRRSAKAQCVEIASDARVDLPTVKPLFGKLRVSVADVLVDVEVEAVQNLADGTLGSFGTHPE